MEKKIPSKQELDIDLGDISFMLSRKKKEIDSLDSPDFPVNQLEGYSYIAEQEAEARRLHEKHRVDTRPFYVQMFDK
ncbi:MAG: hypothetical protein GTO29_08205 [Candidatus Latescibacteria bacterium]|nr:hypothetical protein [Candidatus Latescibacterota bacterium]NIO56144.1 hypothetical protein [Candidatus Latescibacterota bacterium]